MKKIFTPVRILALGLMLGGATVQAQTVSPEMKAFVGMLNGTDEAAENAITKYANTEVKENGIVPYGKMPKVLSNEGSCYVLRLNDEGSDSDYVLCWKSGKIISFDWKQEDAEEEEWGDDE